MKAKIFFCALFLYITFSTKAQNYITIPDANFAAHLNLYYPACMNGNQMDTTCSAIKNEISINVLSEQIADLTGIEYFTNLQRLWCDYNQLTSLPVLPNSLEDLDCSENQISSLPALPNSLKYLRCTDNQLTSLPALPISLKQLYCYYNLLTSLPALPDSLEELDCYQNQLTNLPALNDSLHLFNCSHNQLTSLPALPEYLQYFYCESNHLTSLPVLPDYLEELDCSFNQLTSLPALPNNYLLDLRCDNNTLTSLPVLPDSLQLLFCNNNPLTSLPALPNSLLFLECSNNQLTSLPDLPVNLFELFCDNNNISCFPVFPNSLNAGYFYIDINPFTCLPNYISAMDSATLVYMLCVQGDLANNPHGCESANGIAGYTYKDNNANCLKDTGDLGLVNIPLKLYDNNNNLFSQIYSFSNGVYDFVQPVGTYSVAIDTTAMPFTIQCSHPGVDSIVTTTTANQLVLDVNFEIACKPGIDIGVQSVIANGWVFPGLEHTLEIVAGDMIQWYNLSCSAGVSGQLVVTVAGPVTYLNPTQGALVPTVSGNVFTYTISDFGSVNITQDFGLQLLTDTTAQTGDVICVNVSVTPTSGDINVSNNTYQYCYQVVNSWDPNMKEVYPVNVLPGYQDYFTYTIHFQNTGSAPAFNIYLIDTLSSNLDLETFKVINYSHNNIASLTGNLLTFRFPNIMLPDSTTDEPGSKGFVQYKIKPKASLFAGTQIENTAYIYFNYNAPIATNTTVNEFNSLSIEDHTAAFQMSIYPNPVNDNATLNFTSDKAQQIQIKVLDMLGKEMFLLNQRVNVGDNNIQLNTRNIAKGIYILSVRDGSSAVRTVKFVK